MLTFEWILLLRNAKIAMEEGIRLAFTSSAEGLVEPFDDCYTSSNNYGSYHGDSATGPPTFRHNQQQESGSSSIHLNPNNVKKQNNQVSDYWLQHSSSQPNSWYTPTPQPSGKYSLSSHSSSQPNSWYTPIPQPSGEYSLSSYNDKVMFQQQGYNPTSNYLTTINGGARPPIISLSQGSNQQHQGESMASSAVTSYGNQQTSLSSSVVSNTGMTQEPAHYQGSSSEVSDYQKGTSKTTMQPSHHPHLTTIDDGGGTGICDSFISNQYRGSISGVSENVTTKGRHQKCQIIIMEKQRCHLEVMWLMIR